MMIPAFKENSVSLAQSIGYVALIAALCAVSFYGVVELGFESDDQQYIADAEHVLDGSGTLFSTGRIFAGRPVVEVVFAVTYALWGRSTDAYHLFAVFLHFCASLLTVRVLMTLGLPLRISAAAGVLFTVGVPHYQVVHWVSGIAYSIYYSLGVLSIDRFVAYLEDRRPLSLVLGTVFLSLAVFSHASAIAFLPFGIFLIWYLRHDLKTLFFPVALYAAGAILPFVTILMLYSDAMTSHGAERTTEWGRIGVSWLSYLGNVFLASFQLLYPPPLHTDTLSVGIGVTAILVIAGAVILRRRGLLLGVVYPALMVAPFIATSFDRVQPRYLYAASLGVYLLAARFFVERSIFGTRETRWTQWGRTAAGGVIVVLCVIQLHTSLGVTHGRDGRSLVSIRQSKEAVYHYFRGHDIAGHLYTTDDYVRLTKVALFTGITPDRVLREAVAQHDDPVLKALLGSTKFAFADVDSHVAGARLIMEAINESEVPGEVAAAAAGGLSNVGSHYFNEKAFLEAAQVFTTTVTLDPSRWDAQLLKARAYLYHGTADSAVAIYTTILDAAEDDVSFRDGLVDVFQEAVDQEADYGPYWFLLSRAFALEGNMSKALEAVWIAIDRGPSLSEYWQSIVLYSSALVQEHPGKAPSEVLAGLIEPSLSDRDTLLFVARLYRHLKDTEASQMYYGHILRLDPGNVEALNAQKELN